MPRGDGTGPFGSVSNAGIGRKGRIGGPVNAGPEGYCECPKCGFKLGHNRAEPCSNIKCPQCGVAMVRK